MIDLMKKHSRWLALSVVIMVGLMWSLSVHAADVQKKLINFQGYLTDNTNPPNPLDGSYDLTFKIFESPGSQTPLWTELHTGVTVVSGNVSVLLGSITDMDLVFDEPCYLGIQVGSNPEMTPRQKLLPAFQATAANKLVVTHADEKRSEFGANRLVPIGLIAPYFGNPSDLPDNWKVCDGQKVIDTESPLNGKFLPDLTAKFVRGEIDTGRNTADSFEEGGNDSHVHTMPQHSHGVTENPAGGHNHNGITDSGGVQHTHSISCTIPKQDVSDDHDCGSGSQDCADNWHGHTANCSSGPATAYLHTHTFTTSTVGNHTHGVTIHNTALTSDSTSNIPKYVALHYIIRIK